MTDMCIFNHVFEEFLMVENTNTFKHAHLWSVNFDIVKTKGHLDFVIISFETTDEEKGFFRDLFVKHAFYCVDWTFSNPFMDLSYAVFEFG